MNRREIVFWRNFNHAGPSRAVWAAVGEPFKCDVAPQQTKKQRAPGQLVNDVILVQAPDSVSEIPPVVLMRAVILAVRDAKYRTEMLMLVDPSNARPPRRPGLRSHGPKYMRMRLRHVLSSQTVSQFAVRITGQERIDQDRWRSICTSKDCSRETVGLSDDYRALLFGFV